jgi:hypothetical protein
MTDETTAPTEMLIGQAAAEHDAGFTPMVDEVAVAEADELRVRPETSGRIAEFSEHEAD